MKKLYTLTALLLTALSFGQFTPALSNNNQVTGTTIYSSPSTTTITGINFQGTNAALEVTNGSSLTINGNLVGSGTIKLMGNNTLIIQNDLNISNIRLEMHGNVCVRVKGTFNVNSQVYNLTTSGANNYISVQNINVNGNNLNLLLQKACVTVSSNNDTPCANADCGNLNLQNVCNQTAFWTGSSWTNNQLPDINKQVIINGNYNGAGFEACSLTINTGATLTLGAGKDIKVQNRIINNGSFIVENNANVIQVNNSTNTGNTIVKKNSNPLFLLDYTAWGSPVTGTQTLHQFSPETLANRFYSYHSASNTFMAVDYNNTFATGKGYLIRVPNNFPSATSGLPRQTYLGAFTGVLNNGDIATPIETGFNLVGNPYASTINLYNFLDLNEGSIEGTLWFWRKTNNPDVSSYATVTRMGLVANSAEGGSNFYGEVPTNMSEFEINSGQGFFVKALSNNELQFKNSIRGAKNDAVFFRTQNQISRYWLNMSDGGTGFSQMMVGYNSQASNEYDNGWDGKGMSGGIIKLFSWIEGNDLIIQARGEFQTADVVKLGYSVQNAGQFTISLDKKDGLFSSQKIYLHDKDLGIYHSLKEGAYTFNSELGSYRDRFEIVYKAFEELGTQTVESNKPVVYVKDNVLNIQYSEEVSTVVYDMRGRKIATGTNQIILQEKGIYIVVIQAGDKTFNQKIVN